MFSKPRAQVRVWDFSGCRGVFGNTCNIWVLGAGTRDGHGFSVGEHLGTLTAECGELSDRKLCFLNCVSARSLCFDAGMGGKMHGLKGQDDPGPGAPVTMCMQERRSVGLG